MCRIRTTFEEYTTALSLKVSFHLIIWRALRVLHSLFAVGVHGFRVHSSARSERMKFQTHIGNGTPAHKQTLRKIHTYEQVQTQQVLQCC